jgi:hypothetical protein
MKKLPNPDTEVPTEGNTELNPRMGLLGELAVEMQIVQHRWHPVLLVTRLAVFGRRSLLANETHD